MQDPLIRHDPVNQDGVAEKSRSDEHPADRTTADERPAP
jgi:hypothetical protein